MTSHSLVALVLHWKVVLCELEVALHRLELDELNYYN